VKAMVDDATKADSSAALIHVWVTGGRTFHIPPGVWPQDSAALPSGDAPLCVPFPKSCLAPARDQCVSAFAASPQQVCELC